MLNFQGLRILGVGVAMVREGLVLESRDEGKYLVERKNSIFMPDPKP